LFIFNRWGREVFKINSNASKLNGTIELIWDGNYKGQLMPSSTYFYIIETETMYGKIKNYKGFVVLVK
jgi:gliding motility-associated-like protein